MAPRSAVKVLPSPKNNNSNNTTTNNNDGAPMDAAAEALQREMDDRQNRALDLEHQLQMVLQQHQQQQQQQQQQRSSSSRQVEEAANRLRIPLCEALADMMLTSPQHALHWDVDARLWRQCFYTRIVPYRNKIAKAKKRSSKERGQLEHGFNSFLAEAVTLYQYMATNLTAKLSGQPLSHSQEFTQDDSQTQASQPELSQLYMASGSTPVNTAGMVPLLHLIYIHLGDLFRYSNHLEKAQQAYEKACGLGPGRGHAYNQIAVVCQVKEQQGSSPLSAVALYWYTRSLGATTEAFSTAKSNLARLYEDNKQWLDKQKQNESQTGLSQQHHQNPSILSSQSSSKQPIQTRQFLAEWVDLHRSFFVRNESTQVFKWMDHVLTRFRDLLEVSAFGDALLVKLVSIHAFSEHECRPTAAAESGAASRGSNRDLYWWLLARTATLLLATRMAHKLLSNALSNKSKQQQQQQQAASNKPSVRLLLPLLLVTEQVFYNNVLSSNNDDSATANTKKKKTSKHQQRHDDAQAAFWECMCQVWNHVQEKLAGAMGRDGNMMDDGDDDKTVYELPLLKDYKPLIGFAPFDSFLPNSTTLSDGFVADDDAVALLGDAASQQSQSQAQSSSLQPSQSMLSSQIGLATTPPVAALTLRILHTARKVTKSNPHIVQTAQGMWEYHHEIPVAPPSPKKPAPEERSMMETTATATQEEDAMMVDEGKNAADEDDDEPMAPHDDDGVDDDGGDDVVLYQSGTSGGPALLVPGSFNNNNKKSSSNQTTTPGAAAGRSSASLAFATPPSRTAAASSMTSAMPVIGATDTATATMTPASAAATPVIQNNAAAIASAAAAAAEESVEMDHITGAAPPPPPVAKEPATALAAAPPLGPPPGLKPPPGFNQFAATTTATSVSAPPPVSAAAPLVGATPTGVPPPGLGLAMAPPPPGHPSFLDSLGAGGGVGGSGSSAFSSLLSAPPMAPGDVTVGQFLFQQEQQPQPPLGGAAGLPNTSFSGASGGTSFLPPTNNPFANNSLVNSGSGGGASFLGQQQQPIPSHLQQPNPLAFLDGAGGSGGETLLLDSSLLQSLWMDPNSATTSSNGGASSGHGSAAAPPPAHPTNNPFASSAT